MQVEVFKTSVDTRQQAISLVEEIRQYFNDTKISFDLDDCDKILRVEGAEIQPGLVVSIVKRMGFECEVLE